MIPIEDIHPNQQWGFKKANREDITIKWVDINSSIVYWYYPENVSSVFECDYDQFLKDFFPRDKAIDKEGPNDDRNFLI